MGDVLWLDSPYGLFTFILITLVLGGAGAGRPEGPSPRRGGRWRRLGPTRSFSLPPCAFFTTRFMASRCSRSLSS